MGARNDICVDEDTGDDKGLPDEGKDQPALQRPLPSRDLRGAQPCRKQPVVASVLDGKTTNKERGRGSEEVQRSGRMCVRTQAACADASSHNPAADAHLSHLQVWLEPAVRTNLGVTHVMSILRALSADFASFCHVCTLRLRNGAGLYHRPCS